ncbi:MAG: ABC transporter permease [Plesiomonas sp.]|uniref:ABC transporter permease n=1 Tax=Plesiomonas sp. TaxID=2486279 RepID=UPI003F31D257
MNEPFLHILTTWLDGNTIFTSETLLHYANGLVTTLQLLVVSLWFGGLLAIPLAIARCSKNRIISGSVWVFTYLFRGTPLLIQLYIVYYGVSMIDGVQGSVWWPFLQNPLYPCLLAFSLNTAAYSTEILRGAMQATPRTEREAARAYGMSSFCLLRRIVLPSAFRRVLPAYSNEVIYMLHATSLASVVTVIDITGAARDTYARYYAPFEAFCFAALIYLCLTLMIVGVFKRWEQRWQRHLRPLS